MKPTRNKKSKIQNFKINQKGSDLNTENMQVLPRQEELEKMCNVKGIIN